MSDAPFLSYSQNFEDVVLWRALGHVRGGRYVDVGANDPVQDSLTKVFHDAGWSGICVEPLPELAQRIRLARPDDVVFEGVVSEVSGEQVTLHVVPGTGLSSLKDDVGQQHLTSGREVDDVQVPSLRLDDLLEREGWGDEPVHLLTIDTEGAEADVLAGFDLDRWKPWVLVIEATAPNSTEQVHGAWEPGVLAAGYEFCLFDGLSRYYVSAEHAAELGARLSYPACVFDNAVDHRVAERLDELSTTNALLQSQLYHWRSTALGVWARAADDARTAARNTRALRQARERVKELKATVEEMETSRSWRMTKVVRGVGGGARRAAGRS